MSTANLTAGSPGRSGKGSDATADPAVDGDQHGGAGPRGGGEPTRDQGRDRSRPGAYLAGMTGGRPGRRWPGCRRSGRPRPGRGRPGRRRCRTGTGRARPPSPGRGCRWCPQGPGRSCGAVADLAAAGDVVPPLLGPGAGRLAGLGGAVRRPRHRDAGQVGHGREQVDLLPVAVVDEAVVLAGGLDELGHPHQVGGVALAEGAAGLTGGPALAMVGPHDDQRPVPHALGLELVDDLADQPIGVGHLEQVLLMGPLDHRSRQPVASEGAPEGLVVVLVAGRQVPPRLVGQQQVQEMQGRPVAGPEPVQEVVEARELVAPGLLEAEVRGRGLLGPRIQLRSWPGLVDEQGRVEGGVVRLEDLLQDPCRVPGRLPAARTAGGSRRPACSGAAGRAG